MKEKIAIVGGGVCALVLGAELDSARYDITIYERNAAPGRKFLVAGDGGLNITHSENEAAFISRYTPREFIAEAFSSFSNRALVSWFQQKGIQTYTGSSGRVFPEKQWKPVEVLNVLLGAVRSNGCQIKTKHEWKGFAKDGALLFNGDGDEKKEKADYVVFCLGGASWPVTGSTGNWANLFADKGIAIKPFEASNCSYRINWPNELRATLEGKALKNCVFTCGDHVHPGEVVLTAAGIEGSGVYPLAPQARAELKERGEARILVDLKPTLSVETIVSRINKPRDKRSFSEHLAKEINLTPRQLSLIKFFTTKEDFLIPEKLAARIKSLPLKVVGLGPLHDAISTVGGISLEEINSSFELKKLPRHYAVGEMLDYDAPTGGYLLQSCFSMAHFVARHLNSI